MTLVQPLAAFADVMTPSNAFVVNPDYLIGSASNVDPYGIATLDLYDVAPLASGGTVTNTVGALPNMYVTYVNPSTGVYTSAVPSYSLDSSANRFVFSFRAPSGCCITAFGISLLDASYGKGVSLPSPGNYKFSFDLASDFSYDYSKMNLRAVKYSSNVAAQDTYIDLNPSYFSGDVYLSPFSLSLVNLTYLGIQFNIPVSEGVGQIGGSYAIHFERTASSGTSTGIETPEEDYSADISGSIDSAVEELQYISTSQNLIIQGIDNVIMHISDQLYAFWDQLYNLIHEPTYARLGDILDALRAISNNSDIHAVVETIEESSEKQTADIIANNNSNTSKVESAVEKHGNFIIDGLKGLFIPSDEYFKTYFDDLYSYFSDRFGFLSFPIDLLVRLIDLFANSSDRDCILTLPSFEISGEQLISEASFNLTEFLENDFSLVLSSIRMVTSIGLIMAFVSLCQTKWNEVMRN